jgi:hypothetical protein
LGIGEVVGLCGKELEGGRGAGDVDDIGEGAAAIGGVSFEDAGQLLEVDRERRSMGVGRSPSAASSCSRDRRRPPRRVLAAAWRSAEKGRALPRRSGPGQ